MRKPDFFIVGAPRCGTTAMKNYLQQHPDIFMPQSDVEPHFFGTDILHPRFIRDEQQYLSLFARAKSEKRVGEKSAYYLYSSRSAVEIRDFLPSAHIIIMLRNPVDQIQSMHSLWYYLGLENLADIKEALDAEEDRKRGRSIPDHWEPRESWLFMYRDFARYTHQVQQYLEAFGREAVHVVIFEDFIHSTRHTYRETLKFLNVDPDFQHYFREVKTNREVRFRALHAYLRDPPPFVQSLVKTVIPPQALYRLARGIVRLNSKPAPRLPLKSALMRILQEEFLPEVDQLSRLIGRDLTHWCQSDAC